MPELGDNRFPVIFENKLFSIAIGKGTLKPGYLLLTPKRHVHSFAELNEQEMANCLEIMKEVKAIFQEKYGQIPMTWENGSAKQNAGGFFADSIDHAHLHILPHKLSQQAVNVIDTSRGLKQIDIAKGELQDYRDTYYLLYTDQREQAFISGTKDPERQYIRKIIAAQEEMSRAWNWREVGHYENAKKTLERLREPFRRMQEIHKRGGVWK